MESVKIINERLIDRFGKFENGFPNWRVVWAEDQFEKRWVTHTKDGFELLNPVVEERPKYRQYIQNKWILERLIGIPIGAVTDLVEKYSYECLWTFEDKDGNPLPPKWEVIEIVILSVHKASAAAVGVKYKDDMMKLSSQEFVESEKIRLNRLSQELFANETSVGDALAHGFGVTVGDIPKEIK